MSSDIKTAKDVELTLCLHCHKLNPISWSVCSRCGGKIYLRKPKSIQVTVAWLITAIVFYIPANVFPVMTTFAFGRETASTIVGGIFELWEQKSYVIASIIFIASIIIPILKILLLLWLCLSLKLNLTETLKLRTSLYRLTLWIGRWSMIDVFVVAILVALLQLGGLLSIQPTIGSLAFACVVIATMLAAESFDPRLIWDSLER
ncbi:paraquat-inducible protein A [Catenovulum sp. SX2]|uniref:paraquat-inducible protein A n=1 Tax=Catenovulum sp. SX2 TaxID=3398614 RepID=UPI003F86621B